MPMPATPAMPAQENSSLRNTFSMSRCEIMLPAVARRSPAITTPPSQMAATMVVPCGMSAPGRPPGAAAWACMAFGSSSGAATVEEVGERRGSGGEERRRLPPCLGFKAAHRASPSGHLPPPPGRHSGTPAYTGVLVPGINLLPLIRP